MERRKLSLVAGLVRDLVRALVDAPDQVSLTEVVGDRVTILEVDVCKADHGKVVGRGGRLATAMRDVLSAIGGACKHRYLLEILEAPASSPDMEPPSSRPDDSLVQGLAGLLERLLQCLVDDPEQVRVHALEGLQVAVFELLVAPEDTRRIIGAKGKIVDAIRELVASMGHKHGRRFLVEVMEPAKT